MKRTIPAGSRNTLAALSVVALLGGGGVAYAATSGDGESTQGGQSAALLQAGDREERRAAFAAALATELGVEQATVEAALQAIRADRPGPGEFASALAAELGLEQASVEEALQQVALDRVDDLLAAGEITEEQAAEARERIESGELLPLGPRGGCDERGEEEGENGEAPSAPSDGATQSGTTSV